MTNSDRCIFGATREKAKEVLEDVMEKMKLAFDLGGNRVENRVKVGGGQRNGTYFIDTYISYKNGNDLKVALTLLQDTEASELMARVRRHDMRSENEAHGEMFSMDRFEHAVALYRKHLAEALCA